MKKVISLILCMTLAVLSLSACDRIAGKGQVTTAVQTEPAVTKPTVSKIIENKVTLGYNGKDTLDPFKTKSKTNADIDGLIFDSLFKINSSYDAVPQIAESYERTDKAVIVTIKEGVKFSDSSTLAVSDVVYSFNLAKKSKLYSKRLSNISSATANGSCVAFNLKSENIFQVNCLDFPIVSGSAKKRVGSGRYILSGKKGSYTLEKNKNYSGDQQVEIEKLYLSDISDKNNRLYLLQIGELSFIFDDRATASETEKINANTAEVPLSNLVYLGLNKDSKMLNSGKNIRLAISALIDKDAILSSSYGSEATVCKTPFPSSWSQTKLFSDEAASGNLTRAQELLKVDGYDYAYETNEYISKNFEFLSLKLIYPSGDSRKTNAVSQIVKQFKRAGIEVKAEKLSFSEYKSRLSSGDYDIYLGETKLTKDLSLAEFFSENGNVSYGIDTKSTVADAYFDFIGGKIDVTTFVGVFNQYVPFIPLLYRNGRVIYSREITYNGTVSEDDIFSNIYSWEV